MITCTFFVADLMFGVDVAEVQEVNQSITMTGVPLAPSVIRGLINLRGQVVTAVDLRRLLGFPDEGSEPPPVNLVVQTSEGPVSLLVDQVGDVMQLDPMAMEPPPKQLSPTLRGLTHGIYKLDQKLMLILNTSHAVKAAGVTTAEATA